MEQSFEQNANAHYAKNVLEFKYKDIYDFLNRDMTDIKEGLIKWGWLTDVNRDDKYITDYKFRQVKKIICVAFPEKMDDMKSFCVNLAPYDVCVNVVMAEYCKMNVILAKRNLKELEKLYKAAIKKLKDSDKDEVVDE